MACVWYLVRKSSGTSYSSSKSSSDSMPLEACGAAEGAPKDEAAPKAGGAAGAAPNAGATVDAAPKTNGRAEPAAKEWAVPEGELKAKPPLQSAGERG